MMRFISDTTYEILKSYNDANDDLFGGDIYPLIGSQKATYPFAIYRVEKTGPLTKDGVHEMTVQVTLVDASYDRLCDTSDDLEVFFASYPEFIYQSTEPGFNPDNYEENYMTLNFSCQTKIGRAHV